jgi:ABC-type Fe3+/spermidine/putrescine transport system ATPase subunit
MGLVNLVTARVVRSGAAEGEVAFSEHGRIRLALPASAREGHEIQVAIRPENVHLAPLANHDAADAFRGTVEEVTFLGNMNDYHVSVDGTRLRVQLHPLEVFEVGRAVSVRVDGTQCTVVA